MGMGGVCVIVCWCSMSLPFLLTFLFVCQCFWFCLFSSGGEGGVMSVRWSFGVQCTITALLDNVSSCVSVVVLFGLSWRLGGGARCVCACLCGV